MQLVQLERENTKLRLEHSNMSGLLSLSRQKSSIHEKKIETMEYEIDDLKKKKMERENMIKDLQKQLNQKQCMLNQKELEQEKQNKKLSTKLAVETEKLKSENSKYKARGYLMQDRIRSQDQKLRLLSNIAQSEDIENHEFMPPKYSTPHLPTAPMKSAASSSSQGFATPSRVTHRVSDSSQIPSESNLIEISLTECNRGESTSSPVSIHRRTLAGTSSTESSATGHHLPTILQGPQINYQTD